MLFKKLKINEFAELELKELKRIARNISGIVSSLAILFYEEGNFYTAIYLARKVLDNSFINNGIKGEVPFISYPFPFAVQINKLCET